MVEIVDIVIPVERRIHEIPIAGPHDGLHGRDLDAICVWQGEHRPRGGLSEDLEAVLLGCSSRLLGV